MASPLLPGSILSQRRLPSNLTIPASIILLITPLHRPSRKHRFQLYLYCCMRIRCRGNVCSTRYNTIVKLTPTEKKQAHTNKLFQRKLHFNLKYKHLKPSLFYAVKIQEGTRKLTALNPVHVRSQTASGKIQFQQKWDFFSRIKYRQYCFAAI
jgi:hypothetical protein